MLYIDMNMVRAGGVQHPKEWIFSGYEEIQNPRQRYSLMDYRRLISLLQVKDIEDPCSPAPTGRDLHFDKLRTGRNAPIDPPQ